MVSMRTLLQQLQGAYERSQLTMEQLAEALEREGFKLDRSSLRRQMIGESKMRTDVAEALARVLSVTLVVIPNKKRGAA